MILYENLDCMKGMKRYGDKYFDLAICDPPYGINADKNQNDLSGKKGFTKNAGTYKKYHLTNWDNNTPEKKYFDELKRVSKNQIIWGGNYFDLPLITAWLIWDNENGENTFGDGEMAWTSFRNPLRIIKTGIQRVNRIHPTEKPVKLYEKVINKYGEDGFKILDTHLGSGSIAIAIDKANTLDKKNLTFVGIELNPDYFRAAVERFKNYKRQLAIF